ncbi:MAG: hypothetical protein AAGU74_01265 [Bacillota bacterium]
MPIRHGNIKTPEKRGVFWGNAFAYFSIAKGTLLFNTTILEKAWVYRMPLWIAIPFLLFSVPLIFAIVIQYRNKNKHSAKSILNAYVLYTIVLLVIWIFDLRVPPFIVLLAMLAVFINCFFGFHLAWFNRSKVFDRYLHAFTSFSMALLTYCLIENSFVSGGSNAFRALFVFTIGMTLGAVFELLEAAHDVKSDIKDQKGLKDTNMDLLADFIGSLLAGVSAYLFLF